MKALLRGNAGSDALKELPGQCPGCGYATPIEGEMLSHWIRSEAYREERNGLSLEPEQPHADPRFPNNPGDSTLVIPATDVAAGQPPLAAEARDWVPLLIKANLCSMGLLSPSSLYSTCPSWWPGWLVDLWLHDFVSLAGYGATGR